MDNISFPVSVLGSSMEKAKKIFPCQICGKIFPYKNKVETHMLIHTREKAYSCIVCGKKFNQKGNQKSHQIRHHMSSDLC